MNIALRRDLSNVMLSGHPQVCDLTCERIEDREWVRNRVEQWLQMGNNRSGFCPSKRIKNLTHGSGAGPKPPVNQRSRKFGAANLSIRERTLPLVGPSGSCAGPDETSSRLELSDRFATAQLPFIFPKVSPWVSPKVSPVI